MKAKDVSIGKTYAVKVSERICPVTLTGPCTYGGWYGRNENTSREVRVRTAARLRFEVAKREDGRWARVSA